MSAVGLTDDDRGRCERRTWEGACAGAQDRIECGRRDGWAEGIVWRVKSTDEVRRTPSSVANAIQTRYPEGHTRNTSQWHTPRAKAWQPDGIVALQGRELTGCFIASVRCNGALRWPLLGHRRRYSSVRGLCGVCLRPPTGENVFGGARVGGHLSVVLEPRVLDARVGAPDARSVLGLQLTRRRLHVN